MLYSQNEDKYQNYKPDPDSKTKIIYSQRLFQYGDMVGLRYYQTIDWNQKNKKGLIESKDKDKITDLGDFSQK